MLQFDLLLFHSEQNEWKIHTVNFLFLFSLLALSQCTSQSHEHITEKAFLKGKTRDDLSDSVIGGKSITRINRPQWPIAFNRMPPEMDSGFYHPHVLTNLGCSGFPEYYIIAVGKSALCAVGCALSCNSTKWVLRMPARRRWSLAWFWMMQKLELNLMENVSDVAMDINFLHPRSCVCSHELLCCKLSVRESVNPSVDLFFFFAA